MTGPGQRDPRARRWTIVLVLLALVVAAGVAVRVVDERRQKADRAADRRAAAAAAEESASTTDTEDEPADAEPEAVDDPVPDPTDATGTGTSTALDEPLGISLRTSTDIDGDPTLNVERIGPVTLGSRSNAPYVTSVLGEPDNIGPSADDENICTASWVAWGLEAQFYFGHPPSPTASCERGPVAAALMTGERWFVQPLTGGGRVIGVGDPISALSTAFPLSRTERLAPGLAELAQNPEGHLIAEGSYGGDPYPTLYAIGVDGSIASFLYVSGAE